MGQTSLGGLIIRDVCKALLWFGLIVLVMASVAAFFLYSLASKSQVHLALPDGCSVRGHGSPVGLYLAPGEQVIEIECVDNAYSPPRTSVHEVTINVQPGENYGGWTFGERRIETTTEG